MSEAKARRDDPATSKEAAETVNVPRDRRAVLFSIYMNVEASDADIFYYLEHPFSNDENMPHGTAQSIRSRRAELMRDGYIEVVTYADGTPIYGRTAYGRRCRVYQLTQAGHELARSLF